MIIRLRWVRGVVLHLSLPARNRGQPSDWRRVGIVLAVFLPGMTRPRTEDPASRNVAAVVQLERSERHRRSTLERAIDRLAIWAGRPSFPLVHVLWFAAWITFNAWSARPFDPYPFTFLTLVVSLEAILLGSFVLAAQDRMTREADRRAKLDLQIDMLAEQELTAILRSIVALAEHSGVDVTGVVPQFRELTSDTRIDRLARRLADADNASE